MVDLMEVTNCGHNIIAAGIEQGSGNRRQDMVSTGGDCRWWVPADRSDGKVGRRLSLLHIFDDVDGVACDLWQVGSLVYGAREK